MPIELVWIGGLLTVAAGGLFFLFLRNRAAIEPPHFR